MKLYLGNLPYQVTEGDLEAWFAQVGIVPDSVTLVRDRDTGQARGFGFAEIEDHDQAETAIHTCNGKELMGRPVVVNEARPREPAGGRGGGGYGNRGRRKGPSGRGGRGKRW